MDFLEFSYSQDFSKHIFSSRAYEIADDYCIVYGAPKSGKTSFVLSHLQNLPKGSFLYLDLADLRSDESINYITISEFIKINKIQTLVLDNYNEKFLLPTATQTILIAPNKIEIIGFKCICMRPLVFEEFLLFDKKHQNTTASFNYFLKFGNLAQTTELSEFNKINDLQKTLRLIAKDEIDLYLIKKIFANAAQTKSYFQIFNNLKKEIKISKDRFYAFCEELEEKKMIFALEKFSSPKAVKKLMIYNHAYIDAITTKKNFNNSFSNMVFLELLNKTNEIYYLDGVDFYLPTLNEIILCIPFFNNLSINSKLGKILESVEIYNVTTIKIITVASTQNIFIGNVEATALPFYEWALLDEA